MTPESHDELLAAATKSLDKLPRAEREKAAAALARLGQVVGAMAQPTQRKPRKYKQRKSQ